MSRDYSTKSCSNCAMYDPENETCYERISEYYMNVVSRDCVCDEWREHILDIEE